MTEHKLGPCQFECGCKWGELGISFCPMHATAPELLEALEALFDLNCISYCDYETEKVEAVNQAHAAIARATSS